LKTYIQCIVYFKKESYGELGGEGSWHKLYSMHLLVKRTWFCCHALVSDVSMKFDLCPWPQFQGPKVRDYKSNPGPIGDRFVWVVRSNNTTHWATPIYCMPAFSRLSLVLDDLWMGQKIYNLIVLIKTFHLIHNMKTFQEFWLVLHFIVL
jgi:hypothetical protein